MKTNLKKSRSKDVQGKVWLVVLCLLFAGGIFALLLSVEARQLAKYEKGSVVVAISDVADSKEITKENLTEYFALEERPLSDIPKAACAIDAGSMITKSMVGELQAGYKDAVLLGVNMEALAQSVAGTLRTGDVIDIYTVKAEEDDSVVVEKALGSVTIDRSYTSAGVAILKEDDSSIAQYITIPVHKDAVGIFYQALEDRRIEIVKHP